MHTRDRIVIGCSAGGLEALGRIIQQLPPDLHAAVVIVQHISPHHETYLVPILARSSSLPIDWAEQGAKVEQGHIYVAPPDAHVLFADDHLALSRGPRENHARPSIDKMFRSAAATHGTRTIGVLLTGMLHDGVAGLQAIQDAGGIAIVQDPSDAEYPDLPARALTSFTPDRVLALDAIGRSLVELTSEPVSKQPAPELVRLEAHLDVQGAAGSDVMAMLGTQTMISCPDCNGPMWLVRGQHVPRLRCYLGHANNADSVLAAGAHQVETALWMAIRALGDRAATYALLAADCKQAGRDTAAEAYAHHAREARKHAEVAKAFMLAQTRGVEPTPH